jgi:hypothetical protein
MIPMQRRHRQLSRAWLVCLILAATESAALAVPAFARKYQTSCQTCHILFPKLNAFGEAFRLRGYRMPGETEEMVKEPPVSLGAPAYKKLWPHSVWPGEISSSVPLAVNVKLADVNTSSLGDDGSVSSIENDLQFPQEVNLFAAGTLGEHVSYLGEVTFGESPDATVSVELEHAHMQFDSPFGREDLFHFRLGKYAPNVVDGFQEMWLSTDAGIDSLFNYNPIGLNGGTGLGADAVSPNPISIPTLVRGIEAYGMIRHRALWVAGVANGIGPSASDTSGRFDGNNAKDAYARFDYKFGGMGLDGDTGGEPYVPEKNWRDNSLRLGVFTYRGDGSHIDFPLMMNADATSQNIQDVHFLRTGIYARVFFQDLNVFGTYVHGTDSLSMFAPQSAALLSTIEPAWHAWFTQADYVIYPWLQAGFRYETVTPADRSVMSLRTAVCNVSALVRANVKAMFEYQRDMREGDNHSANALLRFAF